MTIPTFHQYTVKGPAPIPLDMLRYDASFPLYQSDAERAERTSGEVVEVTLAHYGQPEWKPNADRWEGFGWRVIKRAR